MAELKAVRGVPSTVWVGPGQTDPITGVVNEGKGRYGRDLLAPAESGRLTQRQITTIQHGGQQYEKAVPQEERKQYTLRERGARFDTLVDDFKNNMATRYGVDMTTEEVRRSKEFGDAYRRLKSYKGNRRGGALDQALQAFGYRQGDEPYLPGETPSESELAA
jgi:hypothetical protein